jgi:hypothetical protein
MHKVKVDGDILGKMPVVWRRSGELHAAAQVVSAVFAVWASSAGIAGLDRHALPGLEM